MSEEDKAIIRQAIEILDQMMEQSPSRKLADISNGLVDVIAESEDGE